MESLPKYPEYKDSGLEWLGPIPAHWDMKPGLAAFAPRKVKNIGLREKTVLSLSYGRIVVKPQDKLHGLVPESFETYQIVDPGDIIIRGTDLQNDKRSLRIGLSRDRGIITSAYLCFRPRPRVSSEYAYQILNVYDLTKALYAYGSGLRQNLDNSDIKRLPVFLPPHEEQEAIVRFVAAMDRKVRRFIHNRRRLMAALDEQKQAIINRAVTRGLDPNVKLKPSGIDWLGDIPEMWDVRRVRNVARVSFSNVDKHSRQGEFPVRLCNYTDVYKNAEITNDMPFMQATATPNEISAFRVCVGDVIITKDSEDWQDIGVPAVVVSTADDLVCGYHLAILRPLVDRVRGVFLCYALQSQSAKTQLSVCAKGVTRYGLSQIAIKSIALAIPDCTAQKHIEESIRNETGCLETAVCRGQQEIELIREYRTRLIADVVTGKVDVRGLAPSVGDEGAEEIGEELEPLADEENEMDQDQLAEEVTHAD